ncbi:ADP-ribosylation factor-like protein 15 isoform X2 [Acinonyx jubatus]|uniref:ADP-ribosylation factor-like protein 15 isoform X2 n=1 Tax=Acinonyx jubatus TaxID=32536 RepID=A0ABM3NB69_ACIJB|nr:ADP-ribosylation factor-like protein 15 isoform X2 [Acinonyx jubatus]
MLHLSCVSGCESNMTTCFRALCCKGPPPARPEYDLVCIGLTGSGKTSLLSKLCSESPENVVSTTGFSIKAVPFQNAILNVKELGGADNIRKYWSRYYQGSQGVIFVLDSASSEDDLETARNELHSALQHPQLCTLPFLILANHQDKPAARSVQEVLRATLLNVSWKKATRIVHDKRERHKCLVSSGGGRDVRQLSPATPHHGSRRAVWPGPLHREKRRGRYWCAPTVAATVSKALTTVPGT